MNLILQNEFYKEQYSNNKVAHNSIVIVEIDDKTLKDPEKWWLGRWQEFRRSYYAQVIDNLKKDWALVIWIDVLFSEKSLINKKDDEILANSIKNAWNVILAYHEIQQIFPFSILKDVAYDIWDIWPIISNFNSTVYSTYPFYINNNRILLSFSFSVLKTYYEITKQIKNEIKIDDIKNDYFQFFNLKIPFSKSTYEKSKNQFLINYIPNINAFKKISFVDIYKWNYDNNLVKDKIILIWSSATWLHDEFNSPNWIIPWMYTHANIINTILNKKFIKYFSFILEMLILVLFTYLITLLWVYDKHKYYFVTSLFILSICFFQLYRYLFSNFYIIFSYPILFFAAIVLSFIAVNVYRFIYEDKWKRLLKNALSQYLAEDVVKNVLDNYETVKLWWIKKENTIFFSDIAWFTTISERMDPEELVKFLSIYLMKVSDIIMNNKWFINKYEWDAVMALWWAFWNESTQANLACKAALAQQEIIKKLNEQFKKDFGFKISVRMWINKWDVVVWNIWSLGRKIEFTALGDNVNLASRLESVNKYYWSSICVSEFVRTGIENEFVFRLLDNIKVKWKWNAIKIYELIWENQDVDLDKKNIIKEFEKALLLYFNKQFIKAKEIFEKLSDLGDTPSVIFASRCEEFIKNPPKDSWNGIWEFKEK